MPTVQEILSSPRIDPTFSFRPSEAKALGQDMSIQRGSAGWVRHPGTGLIEKVPSGQARITGASQELLIEPQSHQHLNNPQNFNGSAWAELQVNVLADQGTELGLGYDTLEEDTSAGSKHRLEDTNLVTGLGDDLAMSAIAKPNGRDWIYLQANIRDENGNNDGGVIAWFNLQAGEAKTSNVTSTGVSIANHEVDEWHGDWLRPKVTLNMPSDQRVFVVYYGLANGDGVDTYDGQGSGYGVDVLHTQFTSGQNFVTSPILDGSSTRLQDEVFFTIPEADFNIIEGTYFFEFTPRQNPTNFPRILDAGRAEIFLDDSEEVSSFDRIGTNQNNAIGPFLPHQRNRLIVSMERAGPWGVALNGSDSEVNSLNHENAFVEDRPDPGRLGQAGNNAAFSIQEFRYLPRYLPKERRKIETALS